MAYNNGYGRGNGNGRSGGGRSGGGYQRGGGNGGGGYQRGRGGNSRGGNNRQQGQQQERHPLETSTAWLGIPPFETTMAYSGFVNISPVLMQVLLAHPERFYNEEYGTFQLEVALWEGDGGALQGNVRLPFDREMDKQQWQRQLDKWLRETEQRGTLTGAEMAGDDEDDEEAPQEVATPSSKKNPRGSTSASASKNGGARGKAKQAPETVVEPDYDDIPF